MKLARLSIWQLTSMMVASLGFPAMVVGSIVAKEYGVGCALISVVVGNLIVWLVALGIISMSRKNDDAIENIQSYLGGISGKIGSVIIIGALFIWYAIQLEGVDLSGVYFLDSEVPNIWIGVVLGLFVALVSIRGVQQTAKICATTLPVLIVFALVMLLKSDHRIQMNESWNFCFIPVLSVAFTWLIGAINLPTILRHAQVKPDAFLSISLMSLLHIFFQVVAICSGIGDPLIFLKMTSYSGGIIFEIYGIAFVVLFYICANLVNIYAASAGWDALFSSYKGPLKYFAVGLAGTLLYVCLQFASNILPPATEFLAFVLVGFFANLGIVLLIDYLISIVVKHRPRKFEQIISSICWLTGCAATIYIGLSTTELHEYFLGVGIVTSLIAFVIVLFVEETIWAIRHLYKN